MMISQLHTLHDIDLQHASIYLVIFVIYLFIIYVFTYLFIRLRLLR
jgi:hypothetical protein